MKTIECPSCKQKYRFDSSRIPARVNAIKCKECGAAIPLARLRVVNPRDFYCKACGFVGRRKKITRGSFFIEAILWLCFLVPGMIYTVWRLTTKQLVCSHCGSSDIIPTDSPIAMAKLAA